MPNFICTTVDTDQLISRPIALDAMHQVMKYTGLNEKDVMIDWPGTEGSISQPGSTIGRTGLHNQLKADSFNQVTLEVTETYDRERALSTTVRRPDSLFIFRDDRLETHVRPAYSHMEVELDFKFRARDKNTAQRWIDDIRMRVSDERMTYLLDVTYSYFFPPEMVEVLREIHRLRENVAGYGEDFDTWFRQCATPKLTTQVGLNGENELYTIPETQMRIIGYFDFDAVPEKASREDGGDTFTSSLRFKFRYDKPVECQMQYPLIVHNQILDQKWRPAESPYEVEQQQRVFSWSSGTFNKFESTTPLNPLLQQQGLQIPSFDEFIPNRNQVPLSTMRLATIATGMDLEDPMKPLMNLETDMGDYTFDPAVLAFLKSEVPYLTKYRRSIFTLSLFEGRNVLDDSWFGVDADLNVVPKQPLNYREYYHVRLGLVKDLRSLTGDAKDRLEDHCEAAVKLLDTLFPWLKLKVGLPVCLPPDFLPNLEDWIDIIDRPTTSRGNGQHYGFMTVNSIFLTTRKGN